MTSDSASTFAVTGMTRRAALVRFLASDEASSVDA
jgi:hypothetical protein